MTAIVDTKLFLLRDTISFSVVIATIFNEKAITIKLLRDF